MLPKVPVQEGNRESQSALFAKKRFGMMKQNGFANAAKNGRMTLSENGRRKEAGMGAMTLSEINVSSAQKRNTKRTQRSSYKRKDDALVFINGMSSSKA